MARTKQTCRKPTTVPRLPRQRLATMTASGFTPSSPPKKKGPVSVFLSGDVRDLEQDIMHHPSTQPRQSPAMTCYRSVLPSMGCVTRSHYSALPALPLGIKRKPEPIAQKHYSDEETFGSLNGPSPQASLWSNAPNASASQGTDDVRAHWQPSIPGAFDDEEGSTSLKVALAAKRITTTTTTPTSHVMPYWATTSNPNQQITPSMGLAIKKVDVNVTAGRIRDPTIKNDGNNASKPYRYLKASDILVTGKFELAKWDLLVRGVLDWTVNPLALTSTKPPRYEREEDVTGNIAVKKVINDRLNEWRSAFGKKAIQVLSDHVKADVTLRNGPTDTPLEFPLIYSNPMKLKGSWQAPLLLQVFATHLRRVVKSPGNFGFPAGAPGLSTAANRLTSYLTASVPILVDWSGEGWLS
ncbi:hypothetical protein EDB85DRAFT_1888138 [Lactarius pseudohatsudake]|nr:hypothetical protein EDB85DRAFT_1888138 [Lactarius pseudohatsudake]